MDDKLAEFTDHDLVKEAILKVSVVCARSKFSLKREG